MDSLFEDTDLDQLLELLNDQDEDGSDVLTSFFRDKILEKVQEKLEQLMEAEREAFLEEDEGQKDNRKIGRRTSIIS